MVRAGENESCPSPGVEAAKKKKKVNSSVLCLCSCSVKVLKGLDGVHSHSEGLSTSLNPWIQMLMSLRNTITNTLGDDVSLGTHGPSMVHPVSHIELSITLSLQ
jgi:hypothetical protein